MTDELLDASICALLRGAPDPAHWDAGTAASNLARAEQHGLHLLVGAALLAEPRLAPELDRSRVSQAIREAVAKELARTSDLRHLLDATARAGVESLLLKGDAIAPSLYPAAYLRPRSDTDLLIPVAGRGAAERVLASCGYVPEVETHGTLATFQSHWTRCSGVRHAVDLHWRPFNTPVFADVLEFEELAEDSVAVEAFGGRAPSFEHQLIVTAVHRVAHHYDSRNLLWLYDIHLLLRALGPAGLHRTAALATARGVGPIVARGLRRAVDAFGSSTSEDALHRLERGPIDRRRLIFLNEQPRQVDVLTADLGVLDGWPARIRLLREHLFPSRAYMRATFPGWPAWLLPIAYAVRIVRGAPKWFRRDVAREARSPR